MADSPHLMHLLADCFETDVTRTLTARINVLESGIRALILDKCRCAKCEGMRRLIGERVEGDGHTQEDK